MSRRRTTALAARSCIWYCATLDAHDVARGEVAVLSRRFTDAVRASGEDAGACLFAVNGAWPATPADAAPPAEAEPSSERTAVFFSPASLAAVREVLVQYDARPSPAPERAAATLLVGQDSDWNLLLCATH
jgi:hypothetical protein